MGRILTDADFMPEQEPKQITIGSPKPPRIFTDADFMPDQQKSSPMNLSFSDMISFANPVSAGSKIAEALTGRNDSLKSQMSGVLNPDWWTTRPSGEKISAGQAVAGPALSALDALTFGAGDEIASKLSGAPVEQVRGIQESFRGASPVVDTALQIAASLKNPLVAGSKVPTTKGGLAKTGQAIKEGALISGLYGFGEGEYGAQDRLSNALKLAAVGAATGGALTGISSGVSGIASRSANKYADASQDVLEKGVGLQYGDKAKGLNRVNLYVNDAGDVVPLDQLDNAIAVEAPIQQQVKTLQNAGFFEKAPNEPQALKIHLTKEGGKVGKTIPSLVNQADKVIGGKTLLPEFTATQKFLEGYRPETRAGLTKEFNDIIADYNASGGGGLAKLTKFVDQLQKETDYNQLTQKSTTLLKRMISYDMRKASERAFDEALPQSAGAFAKANEIVAATKAIGKTLNKPMARKSPSFGDYITGGSLPMTITTGVLSAPFGFPTAALVGGARLATKGAQQYAEAAFPISTSKFYGNVSDKLASVSGKATKVAGKASIGALGVAETLAAEERSSQISEQDKQGSSSALKASDLVKERITDTTGKQRQVFREAKTGRFANSSSLNSAPDPVASKANIRNALQDSYNELKTMEKKPAKTKQVDPKIAAIEERIDSDPIDSTIYEMESGRNPLAKNPTSTASGGFQLLKKTAASLGVKDVFDLEQNYQGFLKLKGEAERFVDQPSDYYAFHYLGQPTFLAWKKGKLLTNKQQEQVDYLEEKLLPKFERIYNAKLKKKSGMVEA